MSRERGHAARQHKLSSEERERLIRTLQREDVPSIRTLSKRFHINELFIAKLRRDILEGRGD